ncbi:MAG: PilZ domain-containing protein [Nitrospiraceae bacterium]
MALPLSCPQCRKETVLRAHCLSVFERLASLLWVSPFRCQFCSCRFLAFRGGRRYVKDLVDRREHRRIAVRLSLSFSGGKIREEGTVRDLSLGGCVIESNAKVRVDDIFYLQIFIDEDGPPIETAAMVRSVGPRGIGFKFLRSAREDKRLLEYLHAQGVGTDRGPQPSGEWNRRP